MAYKLKVFLLFALAISTILLPRPFISLLTHRVGAGDGWYHPAVTKSAYAGLSKIGIPFNFNPSHVSELGEVAVVLTDPTGALPQVIELKRRGIIKKIVAGPNMMIHAYEFGKIFDSPEIDACVVPSEQLKNIYEEELPSLRGRTHVWPAGVDTKLFAPQDSNSASKNVIVYWKTESESFCQAVEQLLQKHNWNPIRVRYGSYKIEWYREMLMSAKFAIFISHVESQGIALAESWSMNVPTLVWQPNPPFNYIIKGKQFTIPSAPYLNERVGSFWTTLDELEHLLQNKAFESAGLEPRAWVLENMSDEASVKCLLKIIGHNY